MGGCDEALFSDLFEQFFGLGFLFFPVKDVGDDIFVHVVAHEFSETVVRGVIVGGGEACVPCWFREGDELRVNWTCEVGGEYLAKYFGRRFVIG